jgi:putative toxin-antitoxin system antitoxin component (TIGR02293 family)
MAKIHLVIEALGGRGVIEKSEKQRQQKAVGRDEDALIERVRSGLPYSALEAIQTRFSFGPNELLRILRLPYRTLARRKEAGLLSADESDRLVRLGRICGLAEEVLGSPTRAGRWLREPNPALGDTPPLRWLDTDLGTREVELLLSRIAHGVYS